MQRNNLRMHLNGLKYWRQAGDGLVHKEDTQKLHADMCYCMHDCKGPFVHTKVQLYQKSLYLTFVTIRQNQGRSHCWVRG